MSYPGSHHHVAWREHRAAWREQHGYWGRPPESGGRRKARLWAPVVISFLVQVPAVFFVWHSATRTVAPSHQDLGMTVLSLVIALVGPIALIGARRFPGPVVAVAAVAASADLLLHGTNDGPPYVALAFAIVSAIVRGARIWAWSALSACWTLTLVLSAVIGLHWQPFRLVGITLGILIVLGVAEGVRTRRDRYEEIDRRMAQRKQSEVQAERVRIARELHDVLAHSLSQINVQAGVGLHLMDKQPEKAADALASIKETSKNALDEVRSVLGILRAEGGADPSAPLVPEPDLSRLPGLAASVSAQGLPVELVDRLTATPSASIQLALYRIAQESLTNALRHARARSATVTLAEVDGDYLLTVRDDGVGPTTPKADSGGRGLLGMSERAELLGGELHAGASPLGGFEVAARIPVPNTASTKGSPA